MPLSFLRLNSSSNISREELPSTALSSINNEYGLDILAEGSEKPEAYVVAIHGLMGHRRKTWCHEEDDFLWLKDVLPKYLPTTRILTYGYDADIFTPARNDLEDVASNLLAELKAHIDDQGRDAPVIFICHSLGGIVFKQAMVMAHERYQEYGNVLARSKGVAFLGVPHSGSETASWGSALEIVKAVSVKAFNYNKNFLMGLKSNSLEFARIARSFVHRSKGLKIKTFYETRAVGVLSTGPVVVNKESAIIGLPNEETIAVHADHISLPKLCRGEKLITGTVARMVEDEIKCRHQMDEEHALVITDEDKAIVQSLFLPGDDQLQRIPMPVRGTCEWIFANDVYSKWAWDQHSSNLLWVESPPGLGKSVLMRYLVEYYQKQDSVTLCYFFCDSSFENQTRGTSILCSILHQLISRKQRLIRHARNQYRIHGNEWVTSLRNLSDVLKQCLNDTSLGKVLIIVDALDECKDIDNPDHLNWVQAMLNGGSTSQSSLQVILTSRPNSPILDHFRLVTLPVRLDDQSAETRGLRPFIEEKVHNLTKKANLSPEDKQWLIQTVNDRCGGSFLWVFVTIEGIARMTWPTRGTIEDTLRTPPSNLSATYERILDEASQQDHEEVKFLLQVMVAARRPLSTDQLNWISAARQSKGDFGRIKDFINPNFEDKIRCLCGGLVLVTNRKVSLCHKTFLDFLTHKRNEEDSNRSRFYFTEKAAQLTMAEVCVWTLTALGQRLSCSTDIVVYVIQNGAYHIKNIEAEAGAELFDQLKGLYKNEQVYDAWRTIYYALTKELAEEKLQKALMLLINNSQISPSSTQDQLGATIKYLVQHEQLEKNASPVRMASVFGHVCIFRALLQDDKSLYSKQLDDGWTALCTAVDRGQVEMVKLILDSGGDLEAQSRGSNALHYASWQSDANMVQLLLERHAAVDPKDTKGSTPLAIAAALGNEPVVEALLAGKANINHTNSDGNTPLHEASRKGHAGVVRILLQESGNLNLQNSKGQTAFEVAAEQGRTELCRIFLQRVAREEIAISHKGVLHAATRSNNAEIIRMLLDTEVSMVAKDSAGFTAFAYVKPSCELTILKRFVEGGADFNEQGPNGITLLQNAAAQDKVSVVKFLLDRGVNVKQATPRNDTPLHLAVAKEGHKEMFQTLLDHGAELESRNSDGYTPFHMAVASWRSQTTLLILLELGADIEAKNRNGDSPLQTAIRNQNAGLVRYLVNANAKVDVHTSEGYSVHDLAELSFIRHIVDFRVKRNVLHVPYELFKASSISDNALDDNDFQKATGTVGKVAMEKIEHIRMSLRSRLPEGHSLRDVRLEPCLRESSSPAPVDREFVINFIANP